MFKKILKKIERVTCTLTSPVTATSKMNEEGLITLWRGLALYCLLFCRSSLCYLSEFCPLRGTQWALKQEV